MKLNIVDNLEIAPDDGVNYMVELSVGSFRIASGASSGTLSLSASGWKKEGDTARAAYSCHYALYTRSGSSYSRKAYSSSKSTSWASGSQTIASTVDEVIVVISDSVMSAAAFASALPTSILAKSSVAVSKDGDQGNHAAVAFASPDKISIPCDNSGNVMQELTTGVTFTLAVGGTTYSQPAVNCDSKPSGVTVTGVASGVVTIKVGTSATASGLAAGAVFSVSKTIDGKSYSAKVTVALIGAIKGPQGQSIHGDTGKMCYIVGEYLDTIEYTSNSKATVAVEIVNASGTTSELWILTAATNVVNGVHIGPKDSGQQVWEQGLNTYNLIRTKYLFADFAQLGSGIVSGDWLFSMSGVIYINDVPQDYGPSSTYANKPAYLRFDPDYPDSDSGYDNFIPNYAVDLKTGKSYQQDAVLKGTIYASSGTIGGFIIGSTTIGKNSATNSENGYTYMTNDGMIKAYRKTSASGNALDITGSVSLIANSGQNIIIGTGGTGNIQINLSGNASSKLLIGTPNNWKRTPSTVGEVYIDSNNFLKVKVS
jgi:hypothetical protein